VRSRYHAGMACRRLLLAGFISMTSAACNSPTRSPAGSSNKDAGGILASGGAGGGGASGASASSGGNGGNDTGSSAGVGGTATGPNCLGLPSTCGPFGNESCCATITVPGGMFYRGYDGVAPYSKMDYPASVSTFALDKYEVTVGRYRAFVAAKMATSSTPPAAGSGAHPLIPGSGWNPIWNFLFDSETIGMRGPDMTWTDTIGPNENLPMNCVPWYKAFAFCVWDGGRLPTEAEWNYAAAGGDEQREYPWGSAAPDDTLAVFNCQAVGDAGCALTDLLPVGSKPAGNGRYGHADLAGSLWELVLDQYGSYPVPCSDCAAVPTDQYPKPVHRGGSYESTAGGMRTAAARLDGSVLQQTSDLGFRCARAAQ